MAAHGPPSALAALPLDICTLLCSYLSLPDALELVAAAEPDSDQRALACHATLDATAVGVDGAALCSSLRARAHALAVRHVRVSDTHAGAPPVSVMLRLAALLPRLTSLAVPGVALSSAALTALEALGGLRELDVSHCVLPWSLTVTWPATPAFAGTLDRLSIASTHLSLRWPLHCFAALTRYRGRLHDPSGVLELARVPTLRELELTHTRMCTLRIHGEAWAAVLGRLTSLRLENCDLVPRAHLLHEPWDVLGGALRSAPGLRKLGLVDTRIPPLTDELLRNSLPEWAAAGVLTVAAAAAPTRWAEPRRGGPRDPSQLLQLELRPSALLTDATLELVAKCFGPVLHSLELGGNNPRITDAGVAAVARGCPVLAHFSCAFANQVGDAGVCALADSVAARTGALQSLRVNRCGVMSASTLARVAASARGLRALGVRGCHAAANDVVPGSTGGSGAGGAVTGRDVLCRMAAERGVAVAYTPPPACPPADAPAARSRQPAVKQACAAGCGSAVYQHDAADHKHVCLAAVLACPNAGAGCGFAAARGEGRLWEAHFTRRCAHWRLDCPLGCGAALSRLEYAPHVAGHASAAEAAALHRRCPLSLEGCPAGGSALLRHLENGRCAHAAYVCASCGCETGGSARRVECGTPDCAARALVRCRLALPTWYLPPPVLMRALPSDVMARHGLVWPVGSAATPAA